MTVRRKWRFRVGSAAVCAAMVIGGCGGGSGDSGKAGGADDAEVDRVYDETLERKLSLKLAGAVDVVVDRTVTMRFVTRKGEGEGMPFSVASVTLPLPLPLEDGAVVQPEVAVAGMYRGPGEYTVPEGIGPTPTTGTTVKDRSTGTEKVSVIQVTYVRQSPPEEARYGYLLEACEVTLRDRAREGKAVCPALVAPDGRRVAMTIEWGKP